MLLLQPPHKLMMLHGWQCHQQLIKPPKMLTTML